MKLRYLAGTLTLSQLLCSKFGLPQVFDALCHCLPSDACWPDHSEWSRLNDTVNGRLIATTPLGSPCHDPAYNSTQCKSLKAGWAYPQTHSVSPSSFLIPFFQNQSCDPFTPEETPCTLGNYVAYAIDIGSAQDIVAGLQFSQEHNIRLVVKNTGQDLLGKSTGKGALGLWTHNLKSINAIQYDDQYYKGAALKVGAGVQAFEAFSFAQSHNLTVTGGTCPTVGLAGGYTQGGGHGMLVSSHGLSADNVLEWEVVTAEGATITASPTKHSDLYWALSGGGPGTYGVVVSMTTKAFKDEPIGGAILTFASTNISQDSYWGAVGFWHKSLPAIVDSQGTTNYLISKQGFKATHITFPGRNASEVTTLLEPLALGLKRRGIPHSLNTTYYPTYTQHYDHYIGLPYGEDPSNQVTGSRLIPRSVVLNRTSELTAALRAITDDSRYTIIGLGLNVARTDTRNEIADNSVLPAWRQTLAHLIISGAWDYTAPWEDNVQTENKLSSELIPSLRKITPGSGTYMNEADFRQSTWKEDFYGINYPNLTAIKTKYDPTGLFYAVTAVGSDAWSVGADGRMCRAAGMPSS